MPRLQSDVKNILSTGQSQPVVPLDSSPNKVTLTYQPKERLLGQRTIELNTDPKNLVKLNSSPQNTITFLVNADIIIPNITVDTTIVFTSNTNVTADRT